MLALSAFMRRCNTGTKKNMVTNKCNCYEQSHPLNNHDYSAMDTHDVYNQNDGNPGVSLSDCRR